MGCVKSSCRVDPIREANTTQNYSSQWKLKATKRERKKLFVEEGTLLNSDSDDLLELRMFLDDPALLKPVGQYALRREKFELLVCWASILEYMSIPEASFEFQISKALHIYQRYIVEDAVAVLPGITIEDDYREQIFTELQAAKERADASSPHGLPRTIFCSLQRECLLCLHSDVFIPYKTTMGYKGCRQHIREEANVVTVDDFQYMELLGYGSFGFVIHCVKKSTGKHYAMKVQSKKCLVQMFSGAAERVTLEKDVLATCHHPFIVSMDYALQTSSLVMMVMDLGSAGTLQDALECCQRREMSVERVRFYAAEIFLALWHIHRLGLIYRDLKPSNVLLNEDGHVQLVDLGGIIDVGGTVAGYHVSEETMGGMFAPDYEMKKVYSACGFSEGSISGNEGKFESASGLYSSSITNVAVQAHGFGGAVGSESHSASASKDTRYVAQSASQNEETLKSRSSKSGIQGYMTRYFSHGVAEKKRATSIMGTNGFMAPEMLALLIDDNGNVERKRGYTCAVDFWSLGCVMFKLLTGRNIFSNEEVLALAMEASVEQTRNSDKHTARETIEREVHSGGHGSLCLQNCVSSPQSEFSGTASNRTATPPAELSAQLSLKRIYAGLQNVEISLPSECCDVIARLLCCDEKKRLGANGSKEVRLHPFFDKIEWSSLSQKHVSPPYVPDRTVSATPFGEERFDSLAEMLLGLNLTHCMRGHLSISEHQMFETWDFVSPEVVKLEMNAKEEYLRSSAFTDSSQANDFKSASVSVLNSFGKLVGQ